MEVARRNQQALVILLLAGLTVLKFGVSVAGEELLDENNGIRAAYYSGIMRSAARKMRLTQGRAWQLLGLRTFREAMEC